MAYDLDEFCGELKDVLEPGSGAPDLEAVRVRLEKLLANQEFVKEATGPGAPTGINTLYEDPELGFLVLAHNYEKGRTSPPHDHGASWAVYGQAKAYTDMTEYRRKDDGSVAGKADIEETRTYRLEPGMAGTFPPHEIHSIHFPDGARFVRVTGTDLSKVTTLRYDMESGAVAATGPNTERETAGSGAA